jgi:CheY-like chemotaxis protein
LLGCPDEISTTLDVSRNGVLFVSFLSTFVAGMEVAVAFPYTKAPQVPLAERLGRIVRVTEIPDGRRSVAIALSGNGESTSDDSSYARAQKIDPEKPLVLIVDADRMIRDSLKVYLSTEGYEVFAVSCAAEAHEVLKMFTPALLIAEIEGDDLPGFELCAHCKATPRLQTVPVVLLTRSAYPSDYANAHSLGAVVCMAKPYRQERLGHIVRLLAPTEEHRQPVAVRPIDPTRRACARPKSKVKRPSMVDSVKQRPPWRV